MFSARAAYRATLSHWISFGDMIWSSKLPAKIKIFMVLIAADRLSTRSNLNNCERCSAVETGDHLFFVCAQSSTSEDMYIEIFMLVLHHTFTELYKMTAHCACIITIYTLRRSNSVWFDLMIVDNYTKTGPATVRMPILFFM
jgi:hypothetical protein